MDLPGMRRRGVRATAERRLPGSHRRRSGALIGQCGQYAAELAAASGDRHPQRCDQLFSITAITANRV
jgi:hypothetical protein